MSNEGIWLLSLIHTTVVFLEPNKDEIKVMKMIEDMVPDDVIRLGQELGLRYARMKKMSLSSIHNEMAYAWLMCFDYVPQTSGDPTWQALAQALLYMKCHDVIGKIVESTNVSY